ncbi:septal ring lytic transglycosylase RlpA family protein [Candidatus Magnetomonas plexicatena]|uniref:septal ring lytic transglycosylase RlpA family protein n=1 Tax=Candidatus Magnetomonas plexicatena TaxID=2552947 RepID=UPI001C77B547|nr:septal ring lytic transglycosylase RlpA family protein [Nitrospirales bacterium LBB_01]
MKRTRTLLSIVLCVASMLLIFEISAEAASYKASWYGKKHYGRRTASGQIFQKNKRTAAHRTLPFGTLVKVTNISNGESTVVVINDRGPRGRKKEIDLSYLAAKDIGLLRTGIARVKLEVVLSDGSYIDLASLTNNHLLALADMTREDYGINTDIGIADDTGVETHLPMTPLHESNGVETDKIAVD